VKVRPFGSACCERINNILQQKKKKLGTIHPSESGITGSGLRSVTESTQPISRMNSIVSFGPPLCRFLFSFSSLNNS
jgi:hypothetical protein